MDFGWGLGDGDADVCNIISRFNERGYNIIFSFIKRGHNVIPPFGKGGRGGIF